MNAWTDFFLILNFLFLKNLFITLAPGGHHATEVASFPRRGGDVG
jgi:hypothetical protein